MECALQILRYDRVFPGCQTYCTVGFSHFSAAACGKHQEAILAVDEGFERIPRLLANTLLHLAAHNVPLSAGLSKGGIHDLDQDFVDEFDKEALYFTDPFPLPTEFRHVIRHLGADRHEVAEMYLAVFLSKAEHELVKREGVARLEDLLHSTQADPFDLRRASVA
jgi:hypothetical protein